MSLGPAEILVILVVALIVFGPQRLPEVGRQVGSAMRELRRMQHSVRSELDEVMHGFKDELAETPVMRATPALEEPDHTEVSARPAVIQLPDSEDETAGPPSSDPEPDDRAEDGFAGPGGSFL